MLRAVHRARLAISIHAPRTGSDGKKVKSQTFGIISIHAPRTGSDVGKGRRLRGVPYFNPRSPHGERPLTPSISARKRVFQSTLPARGATCAVDQPHAGDGISIHAPRTGSDCMAISHAALTAHFNPRSPHGERHNPPDDDLLAEVISIHAPRTGSDSGSTNRCSSFPFQSTLPARGATISGSALSAV